MNKNIITFCFEIKTETFLFLEDLRNCNFMELKRNCIYLETSLHDKKVIPSLK